MELAPKLNVVVRRHAITRAGRHVLIEASGKGVSRLERARAARNLKRWNEGKRTWLL
jgi:hypothetical protein